VFCVTRPAPALQSAENNSAHGVFQYSLGVGKRVVEACTFFEFGLVQFGLFGKRARCAAAFGSQRFNLAHNPGGAADG
jgi:hypothetical protein